MNYYIITNSLYMKYRPILQTYIEIFDKKQCDYIIVLGEDSFSKSEKTENASNLRKINTVDVVNIQDTKFTKIQQKIVSIHENVLRKTLKHSQLIVCNVINLNDVFKAACGEFTINPLYNKSDEISKQILKIKLKALFMRSYQMNAWLRRIPKALKFTVKGIKFPIKGIRYLIHH